MANIPPPIYPVTRYDVFRRLPDLGMMDPADITFRQHVDKILAYAASKDPQDVWSDFFHHTDGRIIAEWVAGVSAFRQYNELIRIRESGLDTAMTRSGVVEQAFDKGFLIPPSTGGTITLALNKLTEDIPVQRGQIIGYMSTYSVIAAESKIINGPTTLLCAVGYYDVITQPVSGLGTFNRFLFQPSGKYVADILEQFTVGDTLIELVTTPSPDREFENNFLLRRVTDGIVRIYSGNGIVGFTDPTATFITYRCVSYDDDLGGKIYTAPNLNIDVILEQFTVTTRPSGQATKEEVRQSAIYFTPDGRLVQDNDYSSFIMKDFGGLMYDVLDYNTDPDQEIIILKHPNFGPAGSPVEANNLADISNAVDKRRGMGIKINYYLKEPNEGLTWSPLLYVDAAKLTTDLKNRIDVFLAGRCLKMFGKETVITVIDFAVELSSLFEVAMVPDDSTEYIVVPFLGYFTSITPVFQARAEYTVPQSNLQLKPS